MVDTNPFVVVISLDFSKAFDTVRHSMLLTKMAELHMPLPVYNWLVSFFDGHPHRTVYNGGVSSTMSISASIVQGSSLGPASYTVTAADLKPLYADNQFVKYAEDTYLVVPAYSIHTCTAKLDHIAAYGRPRIIWCWYAQVEGSHLLRQPKMARRPLAAATAWHRPCLHPQSSLSHTQQSLVGVWKHPPCNQWQCAVTVCPARPIRHHGMSDVGLQTVNSYSLSTATSVDGCQSWHHQPTLSTPCPHHLPASSTLRRLILPTVWGGKWVSVY